MKILLCCKMTNLKLPDLDMRNVLHVVQENFERVGLVRGPLARPLGPRGRGRSPTPPTPSAATVQNHLDHKTYAIRMIYTGEHALTKEEIIEKFKKSVHYVNLGYVDIAVHGILLVYDSYFVHILEGSEDTLFRQLRFLFNIEQHWIEKMKRLDEEAATAAALAADEAAAEGLTIFQEEEPAEKPERIMFRRLKMLMVYHNVATLRFNKWHAVTGKPPSLVGKLDVYGPIEEHMEQLRICLDKIFKLCTLVQQDINLSFEGLSANDPKMEALPEVALLDFLLQSQYLMELRQVFSLFRRVDDYKFYFERVWPLPNAFTPRYLYKLKIDDSFVEPLPIMPWEMKKGDEEEKEEAQSKSSSSD